MAVLRFNYGVVVTLDDLPRNAVALDGYVQGPQVNSVERKYSFDHHGGCQRLATLSSCQQVYVALKSGLVIDDQTEIFCNDLDADTVLSAWLLQNVPGNPEVLVDPRVIELVMAVGFCDAHGPSFTKHPMHDAIGPAWWAKDKQTMDGLLEYLAVLDRWYAGEVDETSRKEPARGYGLKSTGGWVPVESPDGFGPLYDQGYLAVALVKEAASGSLEWVIAKRSDLVPLAIGPADSSPDRSGSYLPTLLGELATLEQGFTGCSPQENWGGGTSVGGSPRRAGGVGSLLDEKFVVRLLNRFTIGLATEFVHRQRVRLYPLEVGSNPTARSGSAMERIPSRREIMTMFSKQETVCAKIGLFAFSLLGPAFLVLTAMVAQDVRPEQSRLDSEVDVVLSDVTYTPFAGSGVVEVPEVRIVADRKEMKSKPKYDRPQNPPVWVCDTIDRSDRSIVMQGPATGGMKVLAAPSRGTPGGKNCYWQ